MWRRHPFENFLELLRILRAELDGEIRLRDHAGEPILLGDDRNAANLFALHQRDHGVDVARQFDQLVEQDLTLPVAERDGVSMFVGVRPWEFAAFTKLRREPRPR